MTAHQTYELRVAQQVVRERIWAALRRVARPDSRFHWDFSSFIADFEGSDRCAERIQQLDAYDRAELLFVTPDNSLDRLREVIMEEGKPFVMTTYGIARGFLRVDPRQVPRDCHRHAATLDGVERYAQPISLEELRNGPPVLLMITGSSAISMTGVRFGKGHGYFDLEWAIMSELGVAQPATEMAAVGHDCQVVDGDLPTLNHDTVVDWIVTPTRTLRVVHPYRPPGTVHWELLSPDMYSSIPVLGELRELLDKSSA